MFKSIDSNKIFKKINSLDKYGLNNIINSDFKEVLSDIIRYEDNIDQMIIKKRMDIQELLNFSPNNFKAVFRIFIDCTVEDLEDDNKQFKLRIYGKVLGVNKNFEKYPIIIKENFINYLNSLKIEFNEFYNQIHFTNKVTLQNSDKIGIEIKRKYNNDTNCMINLEFNNQPCRYKLSKELKEFIKRENLTRIEIINYLNSYIKNNNLINPKYKNIINLDDNLKKLFGDYKDLEIGKINNLLKKHMTKDNTFIIDYEIKDNNRKIYEIQANININEIYQTMPFYVQKLILDNNDKEMLKDSIKKNSNDCNNCNDFIYHNEMIKNLDFKVKRVLDNIDLYAKRSFEIQIFKSKPNLYLETLHDKQTKIRNACNVQKNLFLKKRNYDENDIINKIPKLYPNLYENEINKYLDDINN